jgi:23S rRNA pseudouridine1911/1915/1917 synthase
VPLLSASAPRADRLDKIVAALWPRLSRSAAQRLIDEGRVRAGGAVRPASYRVKAGDAIEVDEPDPAPDAAQPEAIPLDILYEDDDVLAVNKPAGMPAHPGAGNPDGTLANAALAHAPGIAAVGDPQRPGIVHRLDKETSGVLLIAKTAAAHLALQAQFKARAVRKLYLAVCVGDVQPPRGTIDKPIGRDPSHRQRMAVAADGRPAVTRYAVAEVFRGAGQAIETAPGETVVIEAGRAYSYARALPATGRTHQIRVHFASIGFPIVGDALYGAARRDPLSRAIAPRHLLHASELAFALPGSGRAVTLVAPMPADMRRIIDALQFPD